MHEDNISDVLSDGDTSPSKAPNLVEVPLREVGIEVPNSSSLTLEGQNAENKTVHEHSKEHQADDNSSISIHQNLETERISSATASNTLQSDEELDNNCNKCGYILSSFSTVCPNCGHENAKAKMTMRMPDPSDESTSFAHQNIKPYLNQNKLTPLEPTLTSTQRESAKQSYGTQPRSTFCTSQRNERLSPAHGSNQTIREGNENFVNNESYYTLRQTHYNEPKSSIRPEAIYLGQDGDQNMVNISETTRSNITRSLVDDGDSTISSGVHAQIYKEGNEWKIENKASNKAVFLQVNDMSTPKNGDIIMLGEISFMFFCRRKSNSLNI
ncbi:MAG: zinc ribbon domain-containing protein [Saprospiraceae bacterium]|nr:zinc ribbon domain-containing protein [Saprospiraceae bacterium]